MILAAGRGERMRPLTDTVPKPLLEVRGRPLIEHHVRACASAGIRRIVINLSWLGAQIRDHLGDGQRFGVSIRYSDEAGQPLETAGGIFRALPLLTPGPFAVVNGDVYTDFPFERLQIEAGADAHIVLVPNPPQHHRGDFGLANGLALAQSAEQFTFAGIAVYRSSLFDGCTAGAFPLKPLLLRSMGVRRCAAELYGGLWEDVGTPERLQQLNRR
ncbi:MAG: N-acetylmuramate alpha-1-phosphate uridylyltransferase MurU [Steroidobacteraceae bacterium]